MNSKKIGSDYERVVARVLSKWISGKDDPLICWRTAGSGSVATNDKKKGLSGSTQNGDFQCLDLQYQYFFDKFHIDSKCYKNVNMFFTNTKNMKSNSILNQWKKVVKESGNKIPLMICHIRDRMTPEFVVLPFDVKHNSILYNFINYGFVTDTSIKDFIIITLEDFLKLNAKDFYNWNNK